jgi:hypothetical protein
MSYSDFMTRIDYRAMRRGEERECVKAKIKEYQSKTNSGSATSS